MAGFNFFSGDPQQQALLAVAAGLLESGGPSRTPVSLGQGAARGMMQGRETYLQAQQALANNAMRKAQMTMLEQQARKAKFDADLTDQAMGSGALTNSSNPDKLEMLGTRLALGGHPGGAALIGQAERLRAAQQNRQAVEGMRSMPGTLGAGVTTTSPQGQHLLSTLTGDQEFDSAVLQAQNEALNSNPNLPPQPIQAPRQGLFSPLMASPYVGPYAQQLQGQLDAPSSTGIKAEDWLRHVDRLQQQHLTATNQATARGESAELRRDLAAQADNTRRMLAATSRQGRTDRQQDLQDQREFNRERGLANDFNALSKDFRTVLPAFQASAQYIAGGRYNSSGDRDLAFAFARTLDPKDRVGVNDVKDIVKLGSLPERMEQAIVALAEGKELPDRVRMEMFAAMRNRFESMNELQQQIEDEYEGRASQYMLKPDRIVQRFAIRGSKPTRGGASGAWSAREKK